MKEAAQGRSGFSLLKNLQQAFFMAKNFNKSPR